jgi:putative transposase
MPEYRRAFVPGGTFFFTLVTYQRRPIFHDERARLHLRQAIEQCRQSRPFVIDAMVLLHDHLHAIWTLPEGDFDFSKRWGVIKLTFTRSWLGDGGVDRLVSHSRQRNHRRGVWQRRFWEHVIRDQADYNRHVDYIHYNAIKHGLARCPHDWPHSTFHRCCGNGWYSLDWLCSCDGRLAKRPDFRLLNETAME